MNKKLLFIDWDGTLCTERFWSPLRQHNAAFSKILDDFFAEQKQVVLNWMRGAATSEEMNAKISRLTGLSENFLWETFVISCKTMKADPEAMRLIKRMKEQFWIVLVTGNMDCFTRFTVPSQKLTESFDLIINSADVGYLKTDHNGKIFNEIATHFGIPTLSGAYLIDDSEKTCEIFECLGGKAFRVSNLPETIRHLQLLSVMK